MLDPLEQLLTIQQWQSTHHRSNRKQELNQLKKRILGYILIMPEGILSRYFVFMEIEMTYFANWLLIRRNLLLIMWVPEACFHLQLYLCLYSRYFCVSTLNRLNINLLAIIYLFIYLFIWRAQGRGKEIFFIYCFTSQIYTVCRTVLLHVWEGYMHLSHHLLPLRTH